MEDDPLEVEPVGSPQPVPDDLPYTPWLHDPETHGIWCWGPYGDMFLPYSDNEDTNAEGLTIAEYDAESTLRSQG